MPPPFWLVAVLPLIVLLYFLRLKRRAVKVSTHLFWQRVLNESSRRAFFQRIRQLLSLLLHLLIFFLIVAALSRPPLERGQPVACGLGRRQVLVDPQLGVVAGLVAQLRDEVRLARAPRLTSADAGSG